MKCALLLVVILVLVTNTVHAEPVSAQWTQKWRQDIEFVRETLPEKHADLFHAMTPEAFNTALDQLSATVSVSEHHELVVGLAEVVAMVHDGHTRLTMPWVEGTGFFGGHSSTPPPHDPALQFHHYPIRLYRYSDGLFVQRIHSADAVYAGARVVRIGNKSAEEALALVYRVTQRDNDMQLDLLAPSRLVTPEVLHALGIIEDRATAPFVLETADGARHTLRLSPVPEGEIVEWVEARDPASTVPLSLRDIETNFWFEHLSEHRTVYFQYNEVYNRDEETIADVAVRLTDFISANNVERLVIDLRHNPGGNNGLNRPLLHALIRCEALREPGSLFVIIGRATFSAAMMFCIDLEKHTPAIFVGEPTGAKPNHYGDSRKIQLPNTGLTIRASSLRWQYSGPRDQRPWIAPHIAVDYASEDYRSGRDPALESILALTPAQGNDPTGSWSGRMDEYDVVVHLTRNGSGWRGTLDLPQQEALGLPLEGVTFDAPLIRFQLPIPDQTIIFNATLYGDRIIGGATWEGSTFPWVAMRR